jgi:hypothetical protein
MNKLSILAVLAALPAAACLHGGADLSADSASSAVDSSESTEAEGNLMMAMVDGSEIAGLLPATPEQIAVRIAANIGSRWIPSTCVTMNRTAAQITVTYKDCTGPRGLVHVSGTLILAVTAATTGAITVHGTASDFQVNRATLMVDVTASYAPTATGRTLTVTTSGTGTGPRGNVVDHEGNYTLTWDAATMCHTIAGHWQTDLGLRERSNDVSLQRCVGGCPTGTVTHHYLGGASLTVTFDGTNTAHWTTSTGQSGTTTLGCQ